MIEEISIKQLFNAPISELPWILDCRSEEEYQRCHVQGAISVPLALGCTERSQLEKNFFNKLFESFKIDPKIYCEDPLLYGSQGGYPELMDKVYIIINEEQRGGISLELFLNLLQHQGIPSFPYDWFEADNINYEEGRESILYYPQKSIRLLYNFPSFATHYPFLITQNHGFRYGSDTFFGRSIATSEIIAHYSHLQKSLPIAFSNQKPDTSGVFFPSIIEEWGLYLGSHSQARNYDCLAALGINVILNLTKECPHHFEDYSSGNTTIQYYRFPVDDSVYQSMHQCWEEGERIISDCYQKRQKVLIHCSAGRSRSASLVVYYLIKAHNWSVETAIEFVKSCRPSIAINAGFLQQLSIL